MKLKKYQGKLVSYSIETILVGIVFTFIIVLLVLYLIPYFLVFNGNGFSTKIEDFSGFGSYLSGIGSIFSFCTLIFLIFTYQKDRQNQKKQNDENRLFQYLSFIAETKKSIQTKYLNKTYDYLEINDFLVSCIYGIDILSNKKTIVIDKKKYTYKTIKEKIVMFSSSYMPLFSLFNISLSFIYEDTIELNRQESIQLLLSNFTNEEKIILFFLLNRQWNDDSYLLHQLLSISDSTSTMYKRSKLAYDFYFPD